MKKQLSVTASIIMILSLSACAGSGTDERAANHTGDTANFTKVKYDIPSHGGPAVSSVDNSDLELDRNVRTRNVGDNNRNDDTIRVADAAARKVSDLPEVKHAHIIVANHDAYVAAKLNRSAHDGLTNQLKSTISRTVKLVDHDIDNVYISANPEFFDSMNRYEHNLRDGRSGPIDDFSDTIRRVFPDKRQD
jgi:spore cortex protein